MKERITYTTKCMNCNKKTNYILRSKNSNSSLTDSDINRAIAIYTENPFTNQYCDKCKKYTLQMRVAFDY